MPSAVARERMRSWNIIGALFDAGSSKLRPRDLVSDCAEEKRLAVSLRAHEAGIGYPALKAKMERLASETADHAEALGEYLRRYGIEPPADPDPTGPTTYASMVSAVQEDGLAVKRRVFRYEYLLKDAGKDLRRVLEPIYEDKREHASRLVEVALRICR